MKKNVLCIVLFAGMFSCIAVAHAERECGHRSPPPPFPEAMELAHQGKYTEAITFIKKAMEGKSEAENKEAHASLGLIYYKMKQYDNSLDEFSRAVAIDKDHPMPYYFMGLIYEKKAIGVADPAAVKELKQKALATWKQYLAFAEKDVPPEKHKNIGIPFKKSMDRARQHVKVLEEELRHE